MDHPRYLDLSPSRRHKLRKYPPTSFRATSSLLLPLSSDPNPYISPQTSSSRIARATAAIAKDSISTASRSPQDPFLCSMYTRFSPSSHGSSSTSGSPSVSRSTSLSSPPPSPPSPRKLAKRRVGHPSTMSDFRYRTPPKSKSPRRNFKLKSPFSKNPSRMDMYAEFLPPISSHPPSFQLHTRDHPPSVEPIRTLSPLDAAEITASISRDGHLYGADTAMYDAYMDTPSRDGKQVANVDEGVNLMRRWSLLEVPDEVLAVELEEMRRVTKMKDRRRSFRTKSEIHHSSFSEEPRTYSPGAFVYGGPAPVHKFWLGDEDGGSDDEDGSDGSDDGWDRLEDEEPGSIGDENEREEEDWKRTRRALFCCRELIRTEKSYHATLIQLLDGHTLKPPPTLLTAYLPALVVASNTLLDNFTRDPTAYGISKAFVDAESMLESAFVAYCGFVGEVFMNPPPEKKKSTRRNSLIGVYERCTTGLVLGGTGESMRGSRYVIAEERQADGRRKTTPPDFCRQMDDGPEQHSSPQTEMPEGVMKPATPRKTLKRTMSLFKRKSLPPLSPDSAESPWSPSSSRPCTISSFYKLARSTSLIGIFGFTPSARPVPPPKPPPLPSPTKDSRPHTQSDPIPPREAMWNDQPYNCPTRPTSSHLGASSTQGHGTASSAGHDNKGTLPTVRDLAILPTQRVMRFVLLYRDLLKHTPNNSPTRPLVARALEGAIRIADKCDRAQGNAAFLRRR